VTALKSAHTQKIVRKNNLFLYIISVCYFCLVILFGKQVPRVASLGYLNLELMFGEKVRSQVTTVYIILSDFLN